MKLSVFILFVALNTSIVAQAPIFYFENMNGSKGELVEVDLLADNFNNGVSFFLSIEWDSDVIVYDEIIFTNDDIGLNTSDFNLTQKDRLHISWESDNLLSGTTFSRLKIATIRFLVVGEVGEMSHLDFSENNITGQKLEYYEAVNGSFELVEATYQAGEISVVERSSESYIPRFFINEKLKNDNEIYLNLIGTDFDRASSFLISLVWDPSVLTFSGFGEGIVLNSNISVGNIEENRMVLSWETDDLSNGLTDDFLLLKELIFDIVSVNSCNASSIEFQDIPFRGQKQEYWRLSSDSFQSIPAEYIGTRISVGEQFNLGPDINLCEGQSSTLEIPVDADSIKWYLNNTLIETDQTSLSINAQGLFAVEFELDDCKQSGDILVRFIENDISGLENDLRVLRGTPFEAPEISEGVTYKWEGDSMITFSCVDCRMPIITANRSGFIAVEITDSLGCSSSSSVIVEVINADPIDSLSVFTPFTNPSCNNISDGAINLLIRGGFPPYNVNWSDGNNQTSRDDLYAGNYNVTITDQSGKSINSIISLSAQALPVVDSKVTDKTCSSLGGSIDIGLENSGSDFTVEWISDSLEGSFVEDLQPGIYIYKITDSFDCSVFDTIEILNIESDIDLVSDVSLCPDSMLTLNVPDEFEEYDILWTLENFPVSTDNSIEVFESGNYILNVENENCSITDTIVVTELSIIGLPNDTFVQSGEMIEFLIEGSIDSVYWLFPLSYNTTCVNCPNPIVTPDVSDSVSVNVKYSTGCIQTGDFKIDVISAALPPPIAPINYLSPNGDGVNDILAFEDLMQFQEPRLVVMNEWGKELLDISNYQNNWDGSFNGKKLPDGVYYYFLSYQSQQEVFVTHGDLLILNN